MTDYISSSGLRVTHISKNWRSKQGVAKIQAHDVEYSLGVLIKIIEGFNGVTSVKFADDEQSSILVEFMYGPLSFARLRTAVHTQAKKLASELHGVQDPVPVPDVADATSDNQADIPVPDGNSFAMSLPSRDIRMTDSDYGLRIIGKEPLEGLEEVSVDKKDWPWLRLHSYDGNRAVFALSRELLPYESAAISRLCEFNGISVPEVGDESFTRITLHVARLWDPFVFGFLDIMRRLHWVHKFGHEHAAFGVESEMICSDSNDDIDDGDESDVIGELPLWTETLAQNERRVTLSPAVLAWLIENLPEEFSVSIG